MKKLIIFLLLFSSFSALAQSDSTQIKQSGHYLTFVSKVYLNPTIRLKTKAFKTATNLNFSALPDMGSNSMKETVPIFVGLQKLMNVLLQSDGGIRFYFNPDSIQRPFRFWHSENLKCKFVQADRDSILYYLNQPFADGNISTTNALRYETSIGKALDYVEKCIKAHPETCGDDPQNETEEINTKPLSITVHNRAGSNYDIDTKQHDKLASNYAKVLDIFTQQEVYATSKLLVINETDEKVALAIHSNEGDFKKQNLKIEVLKTHLQLAIDPTSSEDSIFFTLPKTLPLSDPVEVLVKYKSPKDSLTYLVGIFMVKTVERETHKVVLVKRNLDQFPVDLQDKIEDQLAKVYGHVGQDFTVTIAEINGFNDDVLSIEFEESGLLHNYQEDLRTYVNDIHDINDYDDNTYYLFFGLSSQDLKGYMPRARNIGFIFNDSVSRMAKTAAHELGHGMFHFKHIFHEDELGEPSYGLTKNVMDYADVTKELYLHQWNYIQNPAFVSWMGGDDEEGALSSFKGKVLYYLWNLGPNNEIIGNTLGYYSIGSTQKNVKYITPKKMTCYFFTADQPTVYTTITQMKLSMTKFETVYSENMYFNFEDRPKMQFSPSQTYILGVKNSVLSIIEKPDNQYHKNQVVYIDVKNGQRYFDKTSDKLYLEKFGYISDAFEHCYVLSYYDSNGNITNQEVWSPETMSDITSKYNKPNSYYYNSTIGENAFYFWEEDANGNVKDNNIMRPFPTKKVLIPEVINGSRAADLIFTSLAQAKSRLTSAKNNPDGEYNNKQYFKDMNYIHGYDWTQSSVFVHLPSLGMTVYNELAKGKVLYFNVKDHKIKYTYSADSLKLSYFGRKESVKDHHFVYTYWEYDPVKKESYISKQRIFRYDGQEITKNYDKYLVAKPSKRIALYVNGYRPLMLDFDFDRLYNNSFNIEEPNTLNKVYDAEPYPYWNIFGSTFKTEMNKVLNPDYTYFADGHVTASSSNSNSAFAALSVTDAGHFESAKTCAANGHPCKNIDFIEIVLKEQPLATIRIPYSLTKLTAIIASAALVGSPILSYFVRENMDGEAVLSKTQNDLGYLVRFENGKIAGQNLLIDLKKQLTREDIAANKTEHDISKDTLDIVAHSMGFAYSMGMIDELKGKIHFGKYLILAPENPESAANSAWMVNKDDPNKFEQVWHYGADLDMDDESPPCNQDGVAAQADILGLSNQRVRVPKTQEMITLGFAEYLCRGGKDAHFIGSYKWVFSEKLPAEKGIIKRR